MVLTQLRSLFTPAAPKREAAALYIALVQQSRNPFFYTECGVPDTLDGRFDLILLHMFLLLRHLKAQATAEAEERSRLLQERLFDDMDQSLREMGVGDMGVSKRIKAMSKAAYGRLEAYTAAYASDDLLAETIKRNIYREAEIPPAQLQKLVSYARNYKPETLVN
jgi:cytochrome b pre-mRNA-processing protein 3